MKPIEVASAPFAAALSLSLLAGCAGTAGGSSSQAQSTPVASGDNSQQTVTLKGVVDLIPHPEIIKYVTPKLTKQGIITDLVAMAADNTINKKLAKGGIDLNYFQYEPYLEEWNNTNGFNLVNAGDIHAEPITAYSDKYSSTDKTPENATVVIPNDGTNEYRVLLISEQNSFTKLNEKTATSLSASVTDIQSYARPIKIVELDSAWIIPTKADYGFFITNTNKALEARITSTKLPSESGDSPYVNIIAMREEDKDNPAIAVLVKELQSEDTRKFIKDTYKGAVIPAKLGSQSPAAGQSRTENLFRHFMQTYRRTIFTLGRIVT